MTTQKVSFAHAQHGHSSELMRARDLSKLFANAARHTILFALLFSSALAQRAIKGLNSDGPDPALVDKLKLFGQFVGDWEFDLISIRPDGKRVKGGGEWHFGWVLGGRAVQDVWIARDDVSKPDGSISEWGTTVRCYDPKSDVWRVVWVGPKRGNLMGFVARHSADEIVMETDYVQGLPHRNAPSGVPTNRGQWIFDEIKPDSFRWRSLISHDGGKNWTMSQEMFARRVKPATTARTE
jgi:hypothetical protein